VNFNDLLEIYLYAHARLESSANHYQLRNQFDRDKILSDILVGKKAEFNVYYELLKKYPDVSRPDCKIYDDHQKSFDADLYIPSKDIYVHVKAHTKNAKVKNSWTFQRIDPVVKEPESNHWLALCSGIDFLNFKIGWLNACDAEYKETLGNFPSKCAIYL
jgi:hypothetical protein